MATLKEHASVLAAILSDIYDHSEQMSITERMRERTL